MPEKKRLAAGGQQSAARALPTLPLTYESRVWTERPYALVAGCDEVGRGPLAGPVVASCCIVLPPPLWPRLLQRSGGASAPSLPAAPALLSGPWLPPVEGVSDSKAVEEEDREALYPTLTSDPRLVFGTAAVDHATIDAVNILRATMLAMDAAAGTAAKRARQVLSEVGAWSPPKGPASAAWVAEHGGDTAVDSHARLRAVYIDGNRAPPALALSCDGLPPAATAPEAPAEAVTPASKGGKGKGGRGKAPAAPKAPKPVEDEAYAVALQEAARTAMAAPTGGTGGQTVADIFSLAAHAPGAGAAHVPFSTSTSLAHAFGGRVHTVEPVIGGDGRVYCIAAASLVAKVTRDRLMRVAGATWPGYGLEGHKGYGTAAHMAAVHKLGPSPIHRLTFAPLKNWYPAEAAKAKAVGGAAPVEGGAAVVSAVEEMAASSSKGGAKAQSRKRART